LPLPPPWAFAQPSRGNSVGALGVTARGQKLDQEPNDQPHTMLDQERNDQPPMMTCDITYIQYINSEPMPSRIRRAICLGSHPKLSVTNLAAHSKI